MYSLQIFFEESRTFRAARPGSAAGGGSDAGGRVRHRGAGSSFQKLCQLPCGDGFYQKSGIWIRSVQRLEMVGIKLNEFRHTVVHL